MQWCVDFRKDFKYINNVSELNIVYKNKLNELTNFFKQYQNKHINIQILNSRDFLEYNEIDTVKLAVKKSKINQKHISFVINLDTIQNGLLDIIKKNNFNFYFFTKISDFDTLHGLIKYDPTSVFIANELCFDLARVRKVIEKSKKDIKIRTLVNISQTSWIYTPSIKTFFIRPEDVDFYSKYIDIYEFFGDYKKQNTLFEIWAFDKKWDGKLKEIISGFTDDVDNSYIVNERFAEARSTCRKNCLSGGTCLICDKTVELAKTIKESNNFEIFKRR